MPAGETRALAFGHDPCSLCCGGARMGSRSLLALGGFLAASFGAAAFGSYFTNQSVDSWYPTLEKPAWRPPKLPGRCAYWGKLTGGLVAISKQSLCSGARWRFGKRSADFKLTHFSRAKRKEFFSFLAIACSMMTEHGEEA